MSVEVGMFRNGLKLVLRLLLVHIGLIFPLETSNQMKQTLCWMLKGSGLCTLYGIFLSDKHSYGCCCQCSVTLGTVLPIQK